MIKTRSQLRKSILARRASLTAQEQNHASLIISKKIINTLPFLFSKRIAFYFASRGEVSTSFLLNKALALGKECFFPILHPIKHNLMLFGRYESGDQLKKNDFDLLEPDLHNVEKTPAWTLDLVFTPVVAFDSQGHRLGMGGGYYDRTFAFLAQHHTHKPKLIGLAYDFQLVPSIPVEHWDVSLNTIITPSYSFLIS